MVRKLTPFRVTLLYAAFAGCWIAFSGYLVSYAVNDPVLQHRIELVKGFVFVSLTSALLYLLLKVGREPTLNTEEILQKEAYQPSKRWLNPLFITLAIAIPLLSLSIIKIYAPLAEKDAFDDLAVISKLKTTQIHHWLNERNGDVRVMAANPYLIADIRDFLQGKNSPQHGEVSKKFDLMIDHYGYESIFLLDAKSDIKFYRGEKPVMQPQFNAFLQKAYKDVEIQRSDLYVDADGHIHLDWIIPVTHSKNPKRLVGAIVLRSDPGQFILPFVNVWPTHHTSSETFLIDYQTGRMLFLDKKSSRVNLVERNTSLASHDQFVRQLFSTASAGLIKGFDHNNNEVLASYQVVPELNWRLVAKVDRADVLKSLYSMVFWVTFIAFFAVLALLVAFLLLWNQRQHIHNLAVLNERGKSDRLLRQFYDLPFIGMAMISSKDDSWIMFNDYLCTLLGYNRDELQTLNWQSLMHPDELHRHHELFEQVANDQRDGFKLETRFVRKDGSYLEAIIDAKAVRNNDGKVESVLATVSDVSQLTKLTERLADRENHLTALFNSIPDLIWVKDVNGVYLSCNPPFEKLYNAKESEIVGKTDYDFVSHELADFFRENDLKAMVAGKASVNEEWLDFAGEERLGYFETIKTPIMDSNGRLIGVLGVARDITERSASQQRIKRLSQLYALQAQCNQAIVRCNSEQELFESICRDAVELGGLSLAWIGMANFETGLIVPVAAYGKGMEYLDGIQVSYLEDNPYGQGPTGTSVRNNQAVWCHDFLSDPMTIPWRDRAMKFGWRSSASLPLMRDEKAVGALTLYSDTANAVDHEVQALLTSIARDISFALKNFDIQQERRKAEITLSKLSLAVEQSPNTIVITDLDAKIEYVNASFTKATGYLAEEVLGQNPRILHSGHTPKKVYDEMWQALTAGKTWKGELVNRRKDGSFYTEFAIISPVRQQDGVITNYLAIKTDITEHKANQAKLNLVAKVFEQGNEGIMITDEHVNIIMVNRAFCDISGYSEEEVLGKNPSILSSGHQGEDFYRQMWEAIQKNGTWQGEIWNRNKAGKVYPELLSISRVYDEASQKTQYIGIFTDITQHKTAEENIKWLAHFDVLTGLPNRILLNDRINQALSTASRKHENLALLFLDLDRFKNVNDSLGHHIGDELLKAIAKRLELTLRAEDTVSRLGGDEFVLLLCNTDVKAASLVAEKLIKVISDPFQIEQYELSITPSIGIAMYPDDGSDFETLSQNADAAMYRTKQNGRNNYCFFTPDMQANAAKVLMLDNALRRAIERDQLQLYYQPQVDLHTNKIFGAEVLLRWAHPEMGMISPAEFIPIAEESGQIMQIGDWVLRSAVRQAKQWIDQGYQPITIAVNLSAVQFRFQGLPELVGQILMEEQFPADYLELEITESASMDDPESVIKMMQRLHDMKIKLSIDDFGTGYSSLSYLKRFKVNKLKIDQSFVRDLMEDPDDKAIINAIISLAHNLEMQTIAEGVETEAQRDYLKANGCNEMQGYLISRPIPAEEFEQFVRTMPV